MGCNESLADTVHPKIQRILFERDSLDGATLNKHIDYLIEKSVLMDLESVREKLKEMVPEYNPGGDQGTFAWSPERGSQGKQRFQSGEQSAEE